MPRKGRKNPCVNPWGKGQSKQIHEKDVRACKSQFIDAVCKYIPELDLNAGDRLCGTCRGNIIRQMKAREQAGIVLDDLLESLDGWLESDDDSDGGTDHDDRLTHTNEPSFSFGTGVNTRSSVISVASSSTPRGQCPPSQANRSGLNISWPGTSLSSGVSSLASAGSSESGSVFHSAETAKLNLQSFLHNIGMALPSDCKHKKRKLFDLMDRTTATVKSLFDDYAGEKLDQNQPSCNCKYCLEIINAVKIKLASYSSKREKYLILTALPKFVTIQKMHDEYALSYYTARNVSKLRSTDGPFSVPSWKTSGIPLTESVISTIISFYLSDDNSRVSPNARDTIRIKNSNGTEERVAKRTMLANLKDSYMEFNRSYPDIKLGISKFADLRPKNCKWPGHAGVHISCTCIIHENFKLMLEGLKNSSLDELEQQFEDRPTTASFLALLSYYKELVNFMLCSPSTESCYMGYCELCPNPIHMEELLSFSEGNDISYQYWMNNDLITCMEDHSNFTDHFTRKFADFLTHDYIYEMQKGFIKSLKNSPSGVNSSVMTVDFGENYSFVVQDAVQGYHWNNNQATIHPFVLYTSHNNDGGPFSQYKTYFVISDDLGHDSSSFHAFRVRVIAKIKLDYPGLTHIDYVSDGAASQYKNYKNLGNLVYHHDDFNILARWIFTATSHGKSTCDAMSAVVKRTLRLRSLLRKDTITTAQKMYEVAVQELSSEKLEFFFVTKEDVAYWRDLLKTRYAFLLKVPSIRKCHFVAVGCNKTIITKRYGLSEKFETYHVIKELPLGNDDRMEVDSGLPSAPIELAVGNFYAISTSKAYQIGMIIEWLEEGELYRFQMMKKIGRGGVSLIWPEITKIQDVGTHEILLNVNKPVFNEQNNTYRLDATDLARIKENTVSTIF